MNPCDCKRHWRLVSASNNTQTFWSRSCLHTFSGYGVFYTIMDSARWWKDHGLYA